MEKHLLKVPQNQINWFNNKFQFNQIDNGMWIDLMLNNIHGENCRYINHTQDTFNLIEHFYESYYFGKSQNIQCINILNMLLIALSDASKNEYFEIAHNIKLIRDDFNNAIRNKSLI